MQEYAILIYYILRHTQLFPSGTWWFGWRHRERIGGTGLLCCQDVQWYREENNFSCNCVCPVPPHNVTISQKHKGLCGCFAVCWFKTPRHVGLCATKLKKKMFKHYGGFNQGKLWINISTFTSNQTWFQSCCLQRDSINWQEMPSFSLNETVDARHILTLTH